VHTYKNRMQAARTGRPYRIRDHLHLQPLYYTVVQHNERVRRTVDTACVRRNDHALVVVEDEIRVACTSCGGRAAANAHLPWGKTAAAAPAAPGTSGTAAPASAPTGPPPAALPPPEKKRHAKNFASETAKACQDYTQCGSASGYRIAVPPSK